MDIVIQKEEDAWEWLKKAVDGELPHTEEPIHLKFEGWPSLDLKFKGKDFDSSVPSRLMPSLLEAQKEIYRLYATGRYGEENLRKLTSEEKEQLELVVRVEEGSSIFETNLEDVLTKAFEGAVGKMDSQHLLVLFLGAALTWGSVIAWKVWLRSKEKRAELESRVSISQSEERKLSIMADALNKNTELQRVSAGADEFRNQSLSKLKPADKFEVPQSNVVIDGERAAVVTATPREQSSETRLSGLYLILSVDSGGMRGYRVKVKSLETEEEFSVAIPDQVFSRDQLEILKDGEWDKEPVQMSIKGRTLRGQISSATLISASRVPSNDQSIG